ncbi:MULTISPECIES: hypothetical protein [Rhodopseudomonas]|nr:MULTISPECIES: hypothetical protein [Rhodopseudomonas]NEW87868.1 hypothetical protein [Rhodopseudomonas sp. WA056]QDL98425.1 hypothetical protein FLL57_14425 [Rhodopseudomonas palustris]
MDKIDFMNGQIKALLNFANALIKSHPSPAILRHNFETKARAAPNAPQGLSLSEAYIDGMADINRQLAVALEHAIAARDQHDPQPD